MGQQEPGNARARPALTNASETLSDDPLGIRRGAIVSIPGPPRLPRTQSVPPRASTAEALVLDLNELDPSNDELAELDALDRGWTTERPESGIQTTAEASDRITIPCPLDLRPSERPTVPAPAPEDEDEFWGHLRSLSRLPPGVE